MAFSSYYVYQMYFFNNHKTIIFTGSDNFPAYAGIFINRCNPWQNTWFFLTKTLKDSSLLNLFRKKHFQV